MTINDTHNINERAMLVRLSVTQWTARKHDRSASQEVADNHNSDITMGRFNKLLVDKGALSPVIKTAGELRTFHYTNTLPWLDEGARILPAANYASYMQGMRERKAAFDMAVFRFLNAYDQHIDEAKRRLNGLFNAGDYPTRRQISDKFSCEIIPDALPSAGDFRVCLGDIEEKKIKAQIASRVNDAVAAAQSDLWKRCHAAVSAMVERLEGYTGKRDGSFRDSLVENIREMVDLLPRLNVTGDQNLENMRQEIEWKLTGYGPQVLRKDETIRKTVAADAQNILDAMEGYTGMMN